VGPVAESLRVTEIQYHPADSGTEFVELKNIGQTSVNINLVRFTNGIRFVFGDLWLSPGQLILVVQDPQAFEARYGQGLPVAGPYEGSLDNGGDRLRLEDAIGGVILDFRYEDDWYATTDDGGRSLIVNDPEHTLPALWGSKQTWRASPAQGGSPGRDDSP